MLKESTLLISCPFPRQLISLADIAARASDRKIRRVIRAAFANWDDVINVIFVAYLTIAPVAFAELRIILPLDVFGGMRAAVSECFSFPIAVIGENTRPIDFLVFLISNSNLLFMVRYVDFLIGNSAGINSLLIFGVMTSFVCVMANFTRTNKVRLPSRRIFVKVFGSSKKISSALRASLQTLRYVQHSGSLSLSHFVVSANGVSNRRSGISLADLMIIPRKAA